MSPSVRLQGPAVTRPPCQARATVAALSPAVLIASIAALVFSVPFQSCVKIGADEDFELAKPVLWLAGYDMYSQVWDDQPPLYTYLIVQALSNLSYSVAWPRLITCGFAGLLLASAFGILRPVYGLVAASLSALFLMASPGFIELSCSCMQEIPALAPVVAALWVGSLANGRGWWPAASRTEHPDVGC